MSSESTGLTLSNKRLLKKISESPIEEVRTLFRELPRSEDASLELFVAVLGLTARIELAPMVFSYFEDTSADSYKEEHFTAIMQWADNYSGKLSEELFQNFASWLLRKVYKISEFGPEKTNTKCIIDRVTTSFMSTPENMVQYLDSNTDLCDLWIAGLSNEQRAAAASKAGELKEASLVSFFKLLGNLHSHKRRRGGELPNRPWLEFVKSIIETSDKNLEHVTKCFIRAWDRELDEQHEIIELLAPLIAGANEPTKSTLKAAMYPFSVSYLQHLAKRTDTQKFDPLVCFVVVNSAAENITYDAVKWSWEHADFTKVSAMIDVAVAMIANSNGSVLRRLPPFFLMAEKLFEFWDATKSADIAEASKTLARYWTNYRDQFKRESEAEQQGHFFKSNAEIVEDKLGKILVRTQN